MNDEPTCCAQDGYRYLLSAEPQRMWTTMLPRIGDEIDYGNIGAVQVPVVSPHIGSHGPVVM